MPAGVRDNTRFLEIPTLMFQSHFSNISIMGSSNESEIFNVMLDKSTYLKKSA